MSFHDLKPAIQDWLIHLASSPTDARSVIICDSMRAVKDYVLRPVMDALRGDVTLSTNGPCVVLGRRVHIATRGVHLRGLQPHSAIVLSWPDGRTASGDHAALTARGCRIFDL